MNDAGAIAMGSFGLVTLGALSGTLAGLLAGLVGIGGGVVVVPVVYYGLLASGTSADHAAHIAVGTSLAAILPTAVVSSIGHWRAGNTDLRFMREWGPGIVTGVVAAQLAAPHLRGSLMTGIFSIVCLIFAARFALPDRFSPIAESPPTGTLRSVAGGTIGLFSGLAGVGGGIMTNIVMTLIRNSYAQERRPGRQRWRGGRASGNNRRRARSRSSICGRTRFHQSSRLGVDCAGAGGCSMDRGTARATACRPRSQPGNGHRAAVDRVHDGSCKPVKPSMTGHGRRFVGRIDRFCGRCNDGLTAVAIVLAVIVSLSVAYRTAQTLRVPQDFEIVGTTT